jgi:hypothetical protein
MTVLTILTSPRRGRPAHFDSLDAEVRWAEADTLADALPGTDALLLWDFFSTALEDALPPAQASTHCGSRASWLHRT